MLLPDLPVDKGPINFPCIVDLQHKSKVNPGRSEKKKLFLPIIPLNGKIKVTIIASGGKWRTFLTGGKFLQKLHFSIKQIKNMGLYRRLTPDS
ncbi:MAG: hypothetical protein KDE26_02020 [Bacteroidetes bacterium]|nr:hypothetical protein [Bacteroidota bacterium]